MRLGLVGLAFTKNNPTGFYELHLQHPVERVRGASLPLFCLRWLRLRLTSVLLLAGDCLAVERAEDPERRVRRCSRGGIRGVSGRGRAKKGWSPKLAQLQPHSRRRWTSNWRGYLACPKLQSAVGADVVCGELQGGEREKQERVWRNCRFSGVKDGALQRFSKEMKYSDQPARPRHTSMQCLVLVLTTSIMMLLGSRRVGR